jgi:UDP-N-acetylglucosamine--N-acetylmuramyl-(pentapeptide) pyrophosphoryl-undecaprenol N-acetylglucosamine transferase
MKKEKTTVIFTGGGSAGHVTPNFPLMQALQAEGIQVHYVGSKTGIERALVTAQQIPYYSISTGKLRRYWSWQNFLMPFQLIKGITQSAYYCYRQKPQVIFSKGGFVALPVVIGAWLNRIPVVVHESDLSPGLANRLSFPFAKKICVTFPKTMDYLKKKQKVRLTGLPIRSFLYQGDRQRGLDFCGFTSQKPVLLVIAGSLGSQEINERIRRLRVELTKTFQIIHICGEGKLDPNLQNIPDYQQFAYLQAPLADVLACADLVLSRAGATTICELFALKKPHILLPLSRKASRGDQWQNANYCSKQGFSDTVDLDQASDQALLAAILQSYQKIPHTLQRLNTLSCQDSVPQIIDQLREWLK